MRICAIAIVAVVLTGCTTPEQRLADQAAVEGSTVYRNRLQDIDDSNRCVSYGAQPGTEPYANCRAQLSQAHAMALQTETNRQSAEEDRKAALVSQFLANQARQQRDSYDQQMMNIRAWGQRTLQPATPTANCITNYVGNYAYTNCQ